MVEASRGWWSWPRAGLGFATPLVAYAVWGVYVYFNFREIRQTQSPNVPDDGAMMFLFVMLMLAVVFLVALLLTAIVLCIVRRARAFGVGMMVAVLLPLMLLGVGLVQMRLGAAALQSSPGIDILFLEQVRPARS
jgi:hypothetical protein